MATYLELHELHSNTDLIERTQVAVLKAAQAINGEATEVPNHANRMLWAKEVLLNPKPASIAVYRSVLAANSGVSVSQILAATDAALQANVDSIVDMFATGA